MGSSELHSFNSTSLDLCEEVYELALESLEKLGWVTDTEEFTTALAKSVLEHAVTGESDLSRLQKLAVASFTLKACS